MEEEEKDEEEEEEEEEEKGRRRRRNRLFRCYMQKDKKLKNSKIPPILFTVSSNSKVQNRTNYMAA